MRKIEKEMRAAFYNHYEIKKSNTRVIVSGKYTAAYLHGNLIAATDGLNVWFTCAGWNTTTTRSRLNALGCGCYQRNFNLFRDGKEWYQDSEIYNLPINRYCSM